MFKVFCSKYIFNNIQVNSRKSMETKKYYFNSPLVESWLLEMRELKECARRNELEKKMWVEINKLIQAVIYTHKFQRFMPYEECFSVAQENILKSLDKFDPDYADGIGSKETRLFNYLSIVAKQSVYFATKRHSDTKRIESQPLDIEDETDYPDEEVDLDSVIEAERIIKYLEDNIKLRQHVGSLKIEVSKYMFAYMRIEYSFDTRPFNRYLLTTDFYKIHPGVEVGYINNCVRAVMKEVKKLKGCYNEPIQPKEPARKRSTRKTSKKGGKQQKEQRLKQLYTF